jgi:hypothetical protein
MKVPVFSVLLLAACATHEPLEAEPPAPAPTPPPVDLSGWEGFWPWARVDAAWLAERGLPFTAEPLHAASPRVVKLILASGTVEAPEATLLELHARTCEEPSVRAWNEDRCRGFEDRSCSAGQCSYEHFGNCSGLLAGGGWVVTAAHCTASFADPDLAAASAILLSGSEGLPAQRLPVGEVVEGKHDWDHHWVALDDEDPVDVAAARIDDGGLAPFPRAELPAVGEPLFILGFPRVNGRSPEALSAQGYQLVAGTPSASFGRLADANPAGAPLCNPDGNQEHWALLSPCPAGPIGEGDEQTWTGPISGGAPFLTTYDSCNGYSGGPVFDAAGRWVGVNFTLASDTNPQDAFVDHARMVALPVERALDRLGIELGP